MARYDAQIINFEFSDGEWWVTGVDYRRKDCFDLSLIRAVDFYADEDDDPKLLDMVYKFPFVLTVKYGNELDPEFYGGRDMGECIQKAFGRTNLDWKRQRLEPCLPQDCQGYEEDVFTVRKVNGGALFECMFRGDREDRFLFVSEEAKWESDPPAWGWDGSGLGLTARYGWYWEREKACHVLVLSSGKEGGKNYLDFAIFYMEENGAVDEVDNCTIPYIKLEDAPSGGRSMYDYQVFKKDDSDFYVIDYGKSVCKKVEAFKVFGKCSVRLDGVRGTGLGKDVPSAISNMLKGYVNLSKAGSILPGLPHQAFRGVDSDMFRFSVDRNNGVQVIECRMFGDRADRFVCIPFTHIVWTSDGSAVMIGVKPDSPSYGYARREDGGLSLYLLDEGKLTAEVIFYEWHIAIAGGDFRYSYKTLREVMFNNKV